MYIVPCPACKQMVRIEEDGNYCTICGNKILLKEAAKLITPPPNRQRLWSPGVAAVLSFFIPGLGHIYRGRVLIGILLFFCTAAGYVFLIIPGVILHVLSIVTAASGDPYQR